MKPIHNIKLFPNSTIKEALHVINEGAIQIAVIVNDKGQLVGTLTDGDIRRGLIKDLTLNDSINSIINRNPTVCNTNISKAGILKNAVENNVHHIPIVNLQGVVIGLEIVEELLKPVEYPNKVILMVGGLGTRLRPLTESTPKPMLHVGGKPILETIIERFSQVGFKNITLCVNYKSQIIQEYFGDGNQFGVKIDYILEQKRMGTAGALSLLNAPPKEAFFVMNGDILTNVNFSNLLDFHESQNARATMCVREYDFQVPYGVVNMEDGNILSIDEKPTHKFFVSAGIYMLDPSCLSNIPCDAFFDMPSLFEELISKNIKTVSFPLKEYWLDIGRLEEYKRANIEYKDNF